MKKQPNILVFRIGSLGDTLVSLPAFHLLRKQYPDHCITLLTNSPEGGGMKAAPSHQVLMGSGLIDQYIEYPHGRLTVNSVAKLIVTIRKLAPNEVIYLMPLRSLAQRARDLCLFLAAGVWRVRGLTLNPKNVEHRKAPGTERFESEASRLLRTIGLGKTVLVPSLFSIELQAEDHDFAHTAMGKLGGSRRLIAMSIGAKVPVKHWGMDRWKELLTLLTAEYSQYALVFIGSQDEFEACAALAAEWPGESFNLCGRLSPRQSAAVLEKVALFVGHDSGPMHLASSVSVPCVSIFSSRNRAGIWFPFGNEENVFYNNVPCSNCGLSVCIDNEMVCIRSIRARDVADKIAALLAFPTDFHPENP